MRQYQKRGLPKEPSKNAQGRYIVSVTFDESDLLDFNYIRRHLDEGQSMTHSAVFIEAIKRTAADLRRREKRARAIDDIRTAIETANKHPEIQRDDSSPIQLHVS